MVCANWQWLTAAKNEGMHSKTMNETMNGNECHLVITGRIPFFAFRIRTC